MKTEIESGFGPVTMVLSHLILSQNSAKGDGGNLAAILHGNDKLKVTLTISHCLISHGHATFGGGM